MALCLCGCGEEIVITKWHKYDGIPKYIRGHNIRINPPDNRGKIPWIKGKHHSEKTKQIISEKGKGRLSPQKGTHLSEETKLKISNSSMGKKQAFEHIEKRRISLYKGGRKITMIKSHTKRRQFGFIPLNECLVDGWVGHHIDLNYVIFIPEKLHKSIYHSLTKNINMDIINDRVYEWFVKYYGLI